MGLSLKSGIDRKAEAEKPGIAVLDAALPIRAIRRIVPEGANKEGYGFYNPRNSAHNQSPAEIHDSQNEHDAEKKTHNSPLTGKTRPPRAGLSRTKGA
jgi:hypothetical protein